MFNGIFDSQVQTSMMKVMWQMLQSLMKQMEQTQASSSTPQASADASFSAALAKASTASTTTAAVSTASQPAAVKKTTSSAQAGNYDEMIQNAATKYGVNPALIKAVVKAESNFNPRALSRAGAAGLMQLMPSTARGLGVTDSMDPQQNIDGGTRFLSGLLKRYNGSVELALAAYNAGPGAVDKYHGIPPYQETQTYVKRIMGYLNSSSGWSG
jgi:soluble lytic murein transglycosylase-like protein